MDYQTNGSRYGKRPLWQWILLYIIIGGIVYALLYYFVLRKSGGSYNNNTNTPYTAPVQNQQPAGTQQNPTAPTTNTANHPATTPLNPTAQNFTVHANDTSSDITTITVNKGAPVQITFSVDKDGTYHGGLDFRSSVANTGAISPGSSKTISFTVNNSFSFIPYWPSTNIQKPYTISIVVR